MADLEKLSQAIRWERKNPAGTLEAIEQGKKLRQEIDENPVRHWKIISLVREPVARNVSQFFHSLDEFIPDWEKRYATGNISMEDLQRTFLNIESIHVTPEYWFDTQLKPIFEIDVFANPFAIENGYKTYWSKPNTPLLVIRMEDLDRCAGDAMREFLALEQFEIIKTNMGYSKPYADLYRNFKTLPLPCEYVKKIYSSRYARHFYTKQEIERYTKEWTGGIE